MFLLLMLVLRILDNCLPSSGVVFNVYQGPHTQWSFADSFLITTNSMKNISVLLTSPQRSFLECCIECNSDIGCLGVVFDGEECGTLNGTTGLREAAVGSEQKSTVRVMLYHETSVEQVQLLHFTITDK